MSYYGNDISKYKSDNIISDTSPLNIYNDGEDNLYLIDATSGNFDCLLPPLTEVIDGLTFIIKKIDNTSNIVSIIPSGGDLIENSNLPFVLNTQFESYKITKTLLGWQIIASYGNTQNSGYVPYGIISIWSGTIASIPAGWVLCDGTNGTPDLRDRFVVGARQDDAGVAKTNITGSLTVSGGNTSVTSAAGGNHNHGGATGGTALTINQMPAHSHKIVATNFAPGPSIKLSRISSTAVTQDMTYAGNSQAHSHGIQASGGHTHDLNTIPSYFSSVFIMRI